MARQELEAHLSAERLVQEAQARAQAILLEARQQATDAVAAAEREARMKGDADLAARWVALRQAEGRRMANDADRIVSIAVVLAERLIGAALDLDPATIAGLAVGVLAEARGVRRAVIHVHPNDAELLRGHLLTAGLDADCFSVEGDEGLQRGSLRLHTDIGVIDAQLTTRLDKLAPALREALGTD